MATKDQVNAFIAKLAAIARKEYLTRDKWVLPSVCIAQAALETGWGTSGLMTKANAFFGIKAGSSWKGKVYSSKTNECYDGKTYTQITAAFRAYDSLEESVADYYNLICGSSRYAGAVNNGNAESAITAIKNGGYATSPTYIKNVMNIINSYNLTQYDTWDGENQGPANKETHGYKVGDKVRVIDNITYNGVRFATYYDEYDVIQVNGDRVVIGIGNTVTAAVNAANIAKDEEIAEAPADAEVPTDIPTQEETENAHATCLDQIADIFIFYRRFHTRLCKFCATLCIYLGSTGQRNNRTSTNYRTDCQNKQTNSNQCNHTGSHQSAILFIIEYCIPNFP